jgi:glyoxylase-like metal-dependent hydrolase (beta-lactamase superfamily II)
MKIHQIGGVGLDSNIYLIIDKTIALIDAGTGTNFEIVKQNLTRFDLKPSDIELIVNTHCHYDHTGGDMNFVRSAGCDILIHEIEADLLRKGDDVITCANMFGKKLEPINVTRELREGDRIELGELTLEVLHTPGHTAGSICLHAAKQRTLFSGDTVFSDGVGRTDLPTGDTATLRNSIGRLLELDVQSIYPGHGPLIEKNARACILNALRFTYEV